MSELILFKDSQLTACAGNILFEGKTYYLRFPDVTDSEIRSEIAKAELTGYVDWLEGNRVASLQVINRIGFIRLFGAIYDVRSEKFSADLTGNQQFESLLSDLVSLSKQIIFDYSSPTSAHRQADHRASSAGILERFGYYRQLVLDLPANSNLDGLLATILRNPHSRLGTIQVNEFIWNVRQPSARLAKAFSDNPKHLWRVDASHSLAKTPIYKKQLEAGKDIYLPSRALTRRGVTSFDTTENRFIKHVLLDAENVCVAINNLDLPSSIHVASHATLKIIRKWLRHDFIKPLGRLNVLPTSSPALTSRLGYKEVFGHFLKSRLPARHIFDDIKKQSFHIDLKDVAQLYEYWVFYKIATKLLGDNAVVADRRVITKNGRIANSIKLVGNNISVTFNETFTRSSHGSYSISLRPDVVVRVNTELGTLVLLFDAKYRSRVIDSMEDEETEQVIHKKSVKVDDLHKMHCYVDAIGNAGSAVAVYPGTEFQFFHRTAGLINDPTCLTSLNGVGALPLVPGCTNSSFNYVMEKIMQLACK